MIVARNLFSGHKPTLEFYLSDFTDATSVANAVRDLEYKAGGTRIDLALRMVRTDVFVTARGDRADVPNVLILVTDGAPYDISSATDEARRLMWYDVSIVAVGVADKVSF